MNTRYKFLSREDIDNLPSLLDGAKHMSLAEQIDIIRSAMETYCPEYMHGTPLKKYLKLLDYMEKNSG